MLMKRVFFSLFYVTFHSYILYKNSKKFQNTQNSCYIIIKKRKGCLQYAWSGRTEYISQENILK